MSRLRAMPWEALSRFYEPVNPLTCTEACVGENGFANRRIVFEWPVLPLIFCISVVHGNIHHFEKQNISFLLI